jgi:hypothetical protein
MVHHREQYAESDQHCEPERRSDHHSVHFVLPPRLGQEIEEVSDEMAR